MNQLNEQLNFGCMDEKVCSNCMQKQMLHFQKFVHA